MRSINILTLALLMFFAFPLLAQDDPRFSVGVYSAANFPYHTSNYSGSSSSSGATHSFNSKSVPGIEYGVQAKMKFSRPWVGILGVGKTQWNNRYTLSKSYYRTEGKQEEFLLFKGTETYEFLNIQMGVAFYSFAKSSPYFALKANYNHLINYDYDPIDIIVPSSMADQAAAYQNRQQAFDGVLLWMLEIGGRLYVTQNLSINPFATIQLGATYNGLKYDDNTAQVNCGLNLDWWF